MIKIGEKEYRNLQEQVLWNKDKIEDLITRGNLGDLGIKVIDIDPLPDPSALPENYQGDFGDAYLVGTSTPYDLWIWTRGNRWFNYGPLNAPSLVPGPQGATGPQGPQGNPGAMWYIGSHAPLLDRSYNIGDMYLDDTIGNVYQFSSSGWIRYGSIRGPQGIQGIQGATGPQGPQGLQGVQGIQGEPGKPFTIAGILEQPSALPTPSQELQNEAYIVGSGSDFDLYVIVGEDDNYTWVNLGKVTAIEGPQGDTGPQGPQGPAGPQGAAGHPIYYTTASNPSGLSPGAYTPSSPSISVNDMIISADGGLFRATSIATNGYIYLTRLTSLVGPAGTTIQYIELSGTSGTLTSSQQEILAANLDLNYIKMGAKVFRYNGYIDDVSGAQYYSYVSFEYDPRTKKWNKYAISIVSNQWNLIIKTQLYRHDIIINRIDNRDGYCSFSLITDNPTQLTYSTLYSALISNGNASSSSSPAFNNIAKPVIGFSGVYAGTGGLRYPVIAIIAILPSTNIGYYWMDRSEINTNYSITLTQISSGGAIISDKVTPL